MRVCGRSLFTWMACAALAGLTCPDAAMAAASAPPVAAATAAHTTRLILLGTAGGPNARRFRSEPANLLVVDGVPYLIDAGAGVPRQIVWAGFQLPQIHHIFITHHHLDHTAGLEPLISMIWFGRAIAPHADSPVQIYGPPATRFLVGAALDYLSVSERIFRAGLDMPAAAPMFQAHDIARDGLVYQDERVRVTAAQNSHFHAVSRGPDGVQDRSYAYRFDTPTRSVVFTGDSGMSAALERLAQGADVLVSEVYAAVPPIAGANATSATTPGVASRASTYRDMVAPSGNANAKLAEQFAFHMREEHLTPEQVGQLAAAAHVKMVVLTHLVPGADSETDMSRYSAGVHRYFNGPVIVGRDLLEL